MPSLIGTAPNQVPVNAMLGSAAYQDVNNFAVETKTFGDNSDFAASTKFVQTVKSSLEEVVLTTGTGTAYVATLTNPPSAYYNGFRVRVKVHAASVGSATLNVNSLGPIAIADQSGNNISTNFLLANDILDVIYEGGKFKMFGFGLATVSEAQAGTVTNKYITPLLLRYGLNATGSAPIYACRAWVNFNGEGTVAIRASGNVTSITDNGTGNYTVNFTTALPTGDYAVVATSGGANTAYSNVCTGFPSSGARSTSAIQVLSTVGGNTNNTDVPFFSVAVFC